MQNLFLENNTNGSIFRKPTILIFSTLWLWLSSCVPTPTPMPTTPTETPALAASATVGEPIAVITHIEGDVFIESADASVQQNKVGLLAPPLRSSRPTAFQILREGTTLRIEQGGSVTIVCYNNRVYRVTRQRTVTLTSEVCGRGTPIPAAPARRTQPDSGRVGTRNDSDDESMTLQEEVRDPKCEYNRVPVILSPLNTHLLDMQPEIRWIEVTDSIEYILELSSSTIYPPIVVDAGADATDLACVENAQTAPSRVCTHPWPQEWALAEGQRAFLTVSARTSIASRERPSEKSSLRTLSTEQATEVQSQMDAIQALDIDAVTQDILLAGLYMEHELYDQALTTYEQVLTQQPAPVLDVTRGDLYRRAALPLFAFNAYQTALTGLDAQGDDAAVRAAANFGIGATYYNCQKYDLAEPHFVEAADLYRRVETEEMTDALTAAENALTRTQGRTE
ncbi:MAG: hypothetical protein AAF639_21800 [Chloroflexota bacterium]